MAKKKKTAETDEKKPSFEESKEQLEAIVDELELGELPLEKAMDRYKDGLKAYTLCNRILTEAEKIVDVLVREADGALKAKPLDEEEEEDAEDGDDEKADDRADEGVSLF